MIFSELAKGATLALDTAVLIYFLEKHPDFFPISKELFQKIECGDHPAVMATLVFAELLVPAWRSGESRRATQVLQALNSFPHLRIMPLSADIANQSARLRARYNLRTPDAIHLATALAANADVFITNDRDLIRVESELPIVMIG
jgi:predicted nucleic acid-binding protein